MAFNQASPSHHLFYENHVAIVLCKGSVLVFNLHCNDGTSFLELKNKQKYNEV